MTFKREAPANFLSCDSAIKLIVEQETVEVCESAIKTVPRSFVELYICMKKLKQIEWMQTLDCVIFRQFFNAQLS